MPDDLRPTLERFRELPVAVVCDAMDSLDMPHALIASGIARLSGGKMAGVARTVHRIVAPTNAAQADIAPELGTGTQQVIDGAEPGAVVVIAAEGDRTVGCIGDNMATRAVAVGVAGVVIDGAARDLEALRALGLPVFARCTAARQAVGRLLTISIDQPVVCGGVLVRPGDIVLGDSDGLVVVPRARAAEVAQAGADLEAREEGMRAAIAGGLSLFDAVRTYKIR
jgi:4-hydroxy-4-methyl-2-oxoglutarate aldolase